VFFYLCGRLDSVMEKFVVIDINGMGFQVFVDARTIRRLPALNEDVKLYVYTHIRENLFELYGFLELPELELFQTLTRVSGIGPKVAHTILSAMSADDFRAAVRNENLNALMGISGIGKKTAQRIVLELKDKIDTALYIGNENIFLNDVENDAAAALMSLGYTRKEAIKGVSEGKTRLTAEGKDLDVPRLVEYALKSMI
jgi:Holliday junction DNA helicase RuvA